MFEALLMKLQIISVILTSLFVSTEYLGDFFLHHFYTYRRLSLFLLLRQGLTNPVLVLNLLYDLE